MSESRVLYNDAEKTLYENGYYVDNMDTSIFDENLYEVSNNNGEIIMDYLSLKQLVQLSKLLNK